MKKKDLTQNFIGRLSTSLLLRKRSLAGGDLAATWRALRAGRCAVRILDEP